jgi:hypothetical protein
MIGVKISPTFVLEKKKKNGSTFHQLLSWRKKPKISPNFVLEEMGGFVCNPSRCGSNKTIVLFCLRRGGGSSGKDQKM